MSYEIKNLRGKVGLSTDTAPLVFETGLQAPEMSTLNFLFTIDAVSGGIGVLAPATFLCEHSWDGGSTWAAIPNMVLEDITAAGIFRAYVSNATGLVAPNVRVSIVCPVGEAVSIGLAQRTHISPRDTVSLLPPAVVGGIATEATLLDILADTTALLALDYATETTLASVLADTTALLALDFATETTLAAAAATLGDIQADTTAILADTNTLAAVDFATSAKQDDIIAALGAPVGAERTTVGSPYVRAYSSSNITDAAWFEIVAVTAGKIRKLHIFDSSGEQVRLALGPAGSEGEIWRIEPGGPGPVELTIAAGSRLSIRAASGTINTGDLVINFLS